MGKKRDKANENILILIDELIDYMKEATGSYNCPPWSKDERQCDGYDCYSCKEKYYENKRKELEEKYIVR